MKNSLKHMPRWITTVLGVGYVPKGPGTAGSVVGLLLWVPLAWGVPWGVYALTWLALSALGFWASAREMAQNPDPDPQTIVIDEVSGVGVACFLLPHGWVWVGVALVLFRIFDIWKIGPMKYVDQQWRGAKGVMMDDVLAGAVAWILCQSAYRLFWTV